MARGSAESASAPIFSFKFANGSSLTATLNPRQPESDRLVFASNDEAILWAQSGTVTGFTLETPAWTTHYRRSRGPDPIIIGGRHYPLFATAVTMYHPVIAVEYRGASILINNQGRTLTLPVRQDHVDLLRSDWFIGKDVIVGDQAYAVVYRSSMADAVYDEQWVINKSDRSYGVTRASIDRQTVESGRLSVYALEGHIRFVDDHGVVYQDLISKHDLPRAATIDLSRLTKSIHEDTPLGDSAFVSAEQLGDFKNAESKNADFKSVEGSPAEAAPAIAAGDRSLLDSLVVFMVGIPEDKFVYDLIQPSEPGKIAEYLIDLKEASRQIMALPAPPTNVDEFQKRMVAHPAMAPLLADVILKGFDFLPAHPSKFRDPTDFTLAQRLVSLAMRLNSLSSTSENDKIKTKVLRRLHQMTVPFDDRRLRQNVPEMAEEIDALRLEARVAQSLLTHNFNDAFNLLDAPGLSLADLNLISEEFFDQAQVGLKASARAVKILRAQLCEARISAL